MKKMILIISILLSGIFVFAQEELETTKTANTDEDSVYVVAEQMPTFPGGASGLRRYIAENVHYPKEAQKKNIQGTVIVKFVIAKDGNVGDVVIIRGVDPIIDSEVLKVFKSIPKFTPGIQDGEPVDVWMSVPVYFRMH